MQTEVIVFKADHYDMEGNRGLSCTILGDTVATNNKYGVDITNAEVLNYDELHELTKVRPEQFPAKFKANISIVSKKAKNNKDVATIALSNLKFMNTVELLDKK